MPCRLILLAMMLSFFGCKPKKNFHTSKTAYIIGGTNEIIAYDEGANSDIPITTVRASVLLATWMESGKVRFCSGSLIEPAKVGEHPRILTNHHCFAKKDAEGKSTSELIGEACTKTKVFFEFTAAAISPSHKNSCREGSLRTIPDWDVAVFELSSKPPNDFHPMRFWQGDRNALVDRRAYILHHPDVPQHAAKPEGEAVALPTKAITRENCTVLGPFPENEWHLDPSLPFSIRHTCDLIHGSSGSALLDFETHSIIGVNWGGIKVTYQKNQRTDNVATEFTYVKQFLENATGTINTAAPRSQSVTPEGSENPNGEEPQKGDKQLAAKTKNLLCGTLGISNSSWLFWLYGLPLLFIRRKQDA